MLHVLFDLVIYFHVPFWFIQAVSEIAKACRHESTSLPDDAQSFYVKVSTEGQEVKTMTEKRMESRATSGNCLAGLILIFQHVQQLLQFIKILDK